MAVDNPTIVVPGIKGSSLQNFYPTSPLSTWSEWDAAATAISGPDLFSLALDPSARFDDSLEVVNREHGLLPTAYDRIVTSLRRRRRLPVYVFPYDWRHSVADAGRRLVRFTELVRAKVRAAAPGWGGQVDFVTHSMGGLVFRSFLDQYPDAGHVGQVVFIAVPQRGSLDAVEAMVRGESTLVGGRKEMRKITRTFPGVYELLPTFAGPVVDAVTGQALDVFDVRNWQENVTPHGPDGPERNGYDVEQHHLDDARTVLGGLSLPTPRLPAANCLTIYGDRSSSTLQHVLVRQGSGLQRWYDFDHAVRGPGDEVVPVHSALLANVPAIKLTWDDVSIFSEFAARMVSFHAFLPTLDETQSIVGRFLDGDRGAGLLPHGLAPNRFEAAPAVAP